MSQGKDEKSWLTMFNIFVTAFAFATMIDKNVASLFMANRKASLLKVTLTLWTTCLIILATTASALISVDYSNTVKTRSSALFSSPQSASEEAEKFKEQARKLREEIESFQKEKDNLEDAERREIQRELDEKQEFIDQYSAVVPILKPDGSTVEEKVQFPPAMSKDQKSIITVCEAPLPLGIILGESETFPGMTVVDEVGEGSNAEKAGIQVSDVVRGVTACRVEMDQPTWQLIVGGIGQPKTVRFMFGADFKPFEQVMEAIGSNRLDPNERPILLVLERKA